MILQSTLVPMLFAWFAQMEPENAHGTVSVAARADRQFRTDSAAVVEAAFRSAAAGHVARRAVALFIPDLDAGTLDTTVIAMSPGLRQLLTVRGLPVIDRPVVGDDTVLFRVSRWETDRDAETVQFRSAWTTVLDNGRRKCRSGSANVESFRVMLRDGAWTATRVGPVIHGDRECAPLLPQLASPWLGSSLLTLPLLASPFLTLP